MDAVRASRAGPIGIRGPALTFTGDPFDLPAAECTLYHSDALIVIEDGLISEFGPARPLLQSFGADFPVTRFENSLIMPGFIDCHVHYPQTAIIGAYGEQLIDWLNKYTFAVEKAFGNFDHALATARVFLRESLRGGTTTSAVFCTTDPLSVDAFFQAAEELNMRNIAGKVLMDRNGPAELLDTAQSAYDDSQALIDRWHNRGRNLYGIAPRFAPTSTPEQMELAGALWQGNPGTYMQSHLSESLAEIAWARDLYPDCANYVDIYRRYGHLGERAIFGHGIHLSEAEFQVLHDTGTGIAHCPTSNLFLGSGLFRLHDALRHERPVAVGLGTDLGAGTSFSQLVTMNEAYKVAQLGGRSLTAWQAFYLATRGAAKALRLDDTIGSLQPGREADIVVLDLEASELLKYRLGHASSLEETLFVLMTLGDDRVTRATYLAGRPAFVRDEAEWAAGPVASSPMGDR